jgi:hypothetical protein
MRAGDIEEVGRLTVRGWSLLAETQASKGVAGSPAESLIYWPR